jgi:hypothetical protein
MTWLQHMVSQTVLLEALALLAGLQDSWQAPHQLILRRVLYTHITLHA